LAKAFTVESLAVNFIIILRTNFSYKRRFGSFSLVTFWLWGEIHTKDSLKNVDEIDTRLIKQAFDANT
jgi:hypothetical protein